MALDRWVPETSFMAEPPESELQIYEPNRVNYSPFGSSQLVEALPAFVLPVKQLLLFWTFDIAF